MNAITTKYSQYTVSGSEIGICQGGARHLSQSKTAPKQPNLNKLANAGGLKGCGCPTPAEPIFESRAVYIYNNPLKGESLGKKVGAVVCVWLLLSSKFADAQAMHAIDPVAINPIFDLNELDESPVIPYCSMPELDWAATSSSFIDKAQIPIKEGLKNEDRVRLVLENLDNAEDLIIQLNPYLDTSDVLTIVNHVKTPSSSLLDTLANHYHPVKEGKFFVLLRDLYRMDTPPSVLANFASPHLHLIPSTFQLLQKWDVIPDLSFWKILFERGLDPSVFNIPNDKGRTLLHQAIFSRDIGLAQKVLNHLDTKDLVLGRFSPQEIDACRNSLESHEKLIAEALQDPDSLVVQNDCYAVILQDSGESAIFPGVDVRMLAKQIDREWSRSVVHSSGGHGSIAYSNVHYGLYPASYVADDEYRMPCAIADDSRHASLSDEKLGFKLTLYTTKSQVAEMGKYVELSSWQCKTQEKKYSFAAGNCVDFIKDTVKVTGLNVDIGDAILTSQVWTRFTVANFYFIISSDGPQNIPLLSSSNESKSYQSIDKVSRKTIRYMTYGTATVLLLFAVKGVVKGVRKSAEIAGRTWDRIISVTDDLCIPDN